MISPRNCLMILFWAALVSSCARNVADGVDLAAEDEKAANLRLVDEVRRSLSSSAQGRCRVPSDLAVDISHLRAFLSGDYQIVGANWDKPMSFVLLTVRSADSVLSIHAYLDSKTNSCKSYEIYRVVD